MRKSMVLWMVLWSLTGSAQSDHSLPLMYKLPQRTMTNPALGFEGNYFVGLPGFSFRFDHSGKGLKDTWSVDDRVLKINTDQWVANLDENNIMNSDFEIQSFILGFKTGSFVWTINHSFRNHIYTEYARGLAEFIHFGNADYIGDTMTLDFKNDWMSYSTLNVGLGWQSERLSIGARLHYLSGAQRFFTHPGKLRLYTDDEIYQLRFQSDLEVESSSFVSARDIDRLTFEFSGLDAYRWFSKNFGLGLDLGATMNLRQKLTAEISVLDLGFIRWAEVNKYKTAEQFSFEGIDIQQVADLDSLDLEEALDTLSSLAGVTETVEEGRVVSLRPRVLLGLHYQLGTRWVLSGMYQSTAVLEKSFSTWAIGVQVEPLSWLTLGANVGHRLDRWNLGFNTSLRLAFVEVFFAVDHVPGMLYLNQLGSGSIRLGGNLRF